MNDLAHYTRRMLQALDIYWLHYDGLPPSKWDTVRSEATDEDWWIRFEKYRAKVEKLIGGDRPVSALARLLEQATPDEWVVDAYDEGLDVRGEHAVARLAGAMTMGEDADPGVKARALADASLIALAPDMARLLIDIVEDDGTTLRPSLFSRYLELEQRAAP